MSKLKQFLLSGLFLLSCLPFLQSQSVSVVQFRQVSAEDRAEFIHRETTYWSEVARKGIKDGKLVGWELWERVGGWNMENGSNFIFVNQFANPQQMDNLNSIWNINEVFPKRRISEIETNSLSTLKHMVVFQGNSFANSGQTSEYIRVNYSKASDMAKYMELESSVWQPFIKKQMDTGNTTQVSWFSAGMLMPAGGDLPFNAVSVDGYKKFSEAVMPSTSFKTEPTFPDFTEINKVHEKVYVQVYRKVKVVR